MSPVNLPQTQDRVRLLVGLALVAFLAAGCAGDAEKYDRPFLSSEIAARTGQTVGPGAVPGKISVPEGVSVDDGVSEEEAIAIALWNNASFQEAIAGLGVSRADLIQAGLLTNPSFYILFPIGPKQLEFTLKWPLEALWLRPMRLAAATMDCEKAAFLLVEHGLTLIRDVKVACAALREARKRLALAIETGGLLDEIAGLQDARLRAGDASELEVNGAHVKALKARAATARLSSEARIAEERLRALLGYGQLAVPLRFEEDPPPMPPVPVDPQDLLEEALATRPDVRAAELAIEAAGERAGLARWESYKITAALDANEKGEKGYEFGPGLELEIPLFDLGQGKRARTDAALEQAARHYVAVRDAIALGVKEAHARFLDALDARDGWNGKILPALREACDRTESSREDGEASHLKVLESRELLLEARTEELALEKAVFVAKAELELQVGCRLPRSARAESEPPIVPMAASPLSASRSAEEK